MLAGPLHREGFSKPIPSSVTLVQDYAGVDFDFNFNVLGMGMPDGIAQCPGQDGQERLSDYR